MSSLSYLWIYLRISSIRTFLQLLHYYQILYRYLLLFFFWWLSSLQAIFLLSSKPRRKFAGIDITGNIWTLLGFGLERRLISERKAELWFFFISRINNFLILSIQLSYFFIDADNITKTSLSKLLFQSSYLLFNNLSSRFLNSQNLSCFFTILFYYMPMLK